MEIKYTKMLAMITQGVEGLFVIFFLLCNDQHLLTVVH